jgi:endonuclease-8
VPEGPSIVILREQAAPLFEGKVVRAAAGNTKTLDPVRMRGRKIVALRSWGKHFLVEFPGFALKVHFMLFGSWRIDEEREGMSPRLSLRVARHVLNLYACSVRWIEGDLEDAYDWRTDVMADAWDPALARKRLKAMPDALACDALLDQSVFAGVGNIIKNEVLFRIRVHPLSTVGALPPRKLGEMIREARMYSFQFLEWKKAYVLRQHWLAHRKSACPRCDLKFTVAHLGRTHRRAFFCGNCQVLHAPSPKVGARRKKVAKNPRGATP